jgi:uncharacterized protein YukE
MTINPLVAARVEGEKSDWAGVWIAEDILLIQQGIENGSWIDGTLGVVGAGLDALSLITDPVGTLLQYGLSWLIEHVKPLSDALDWLAGDPAQIAANAQTWRNVSESLRQSVIDLANAVRNDLTSWDAQAGSAYRDWSKQQQDAIEGLARAADTMGTLTECAGFLIAAVRMLVRDAIATVVSRLITYAAELVFSAGFLTPLVVEQATALVASWTAKIARWLKALINSLRKLQPIIGKLDELIAELRKILSKLRRSPDNGLPKPNGPDRKLIDELVANGIKVNPDDVVRIGRDSSGKIIFLEVGNPKAGLEHVMTHADDFAKVGVPKEAIPDLVMKAATEGKIVGYQGKGTGRPIYEVEFNGQPIRVAVTVGSNGFIVGANPTGRGGS